MLCAGFEESHLMMWSLTPQPLPCRRDSNDVNKPVDTAVADSDETQRRFPVYLPLHCSLQGEAKNRAIGHF